MTWVEVVGVLAFGMNVWGNMMLARLKQAGWLIRQATNVAWIVYAANTSGGWPVLVNHIVFLYINVDGWLSWRKAQRSGKLQA